MKGAPKRPIFVRLINRCGADGEKTVAKVAQLWRTYDHSASPFV